MADLAAAVGSRPAAREVPPLVGACGAATSPRRSASSSTTAAAVFAKTHPTPPPGSSPPRRPACGGWPSPARSRSRRCWPCPTATTAIHRSSSLGWIELGHPRPTTEADLGRALAALHRADAGRVRREDRRTTGSRGLPNEPCDDVGRVLRDAAPGAPRPPGSRRRRAARRAPSPRSSASTPTGCARSAVPTEPPARLHGDLWAGNRRRRDGQSWLIDPAAHGGHREFDLAMMRLFGGFGADCFAAYEEVHPLAAGWEDRVAAPPDRAARRPRHQVRRRLRRRGRPTPSPATPEPRSDGERARTGNVPMPTTAGGAAVKRNERPASCAEARAGARRSGCPRRAAPSGSAARRRRCCRCSPSRCRPRPRRRRSAARPSSGPGRGATGRRSASVPQCRPIRCGTGRRDPSTSSRRAGRPGLRLRVASTSMPGTSTTRARSSPARSWPSG